MFLHSGASLHGHEFTTHHLQIPHQPRKKPFLRSALPTPMLRSSTTGRASDPKPPSQRVVVRRRPVSELNQPIIADLRDDEHVLRRTVPTIPVVRFQDVEVAPAPTAKLAMSEDDPSVYDSDASQNSVSTSRRRRWRRRVTEERTVTSFVVALPAPYSVTKKVLLKSIRPRLVVQLQELASRTRPTPVIDVFPASLIAGPLTTARYAHRYPRLFQAKGELCPRDLILMKAEDYTHDSVDDDDGHREPIAVLGRGRGQDDLGDIVLDDGSVWKCSSDKGNFNFVRVNKTGVPFTVRWVKRSPRRRLSNASSVACSFSPPPKGDATDSDYKFAFSIINPLTRRHPILAYMWGPSIQIFNDYTTPAASLNRYTPSRPMSVIMEPNKAGGLPMSPRSMNEVFAQRETHLVDEETKKLIMVTGLWMSLHLGSAQDPFETTDYPPAALSPEPVMSLPLIGSAHTMPRRLTSNESTCVQPPPVQKGLRRALSTGASFLQRRKAREPANTHNNTTIIDKGFTAGVESNRNSIYGHTVMGQPRVEETTAMVTPLQKQNRRMGWFRKLTH